MAASDLGLFLLRVVVGLVFAAHGAQKAFGWWSGPGFGGWRGAMEKMGFWPNGFWAVVSVAAELGAGVLLVLGFLTPLAVAALVAQSVVIILHAHLPKGFWNRVGGIEFPLTLAAGVVAIAGTGPGKLSLDAALSLTYPSVDRAGLLLIGILGGLLGLAMPHLRAQQSATASQTR